jgi:hypothetical protein
MHRFFSLVVAGTTASAAAFADDHASLRGTYADTGVTSCVEDSASLGFNPNFTPKRGRPFSSPPPTKASGCFTPMAPAR